MANSSLVTVLSGLLCVMALSCGLRASAALTGLNGPMNNFNVDFLKQVYKPDGKNVFFSSVSIASAFSMVLAGASENSESELLKGLRFDGMTSEVAHAHVGKVMTALKSKPASDKTYELNLANKMLVDEKYNAKKSFLEMIAKNYNSEVVLANFRTNSPQVTADINKWVSEQTRGKINKVFDAPLSPLTRLVIMNAIYFKGKWAEKFNADNTKKAAFYNHGKDEKQVDTMYKAKSALRYARQEDHALLELDYIGNASMVIVLPNERTGLENVLKNFQASKVEQLLTQVHKGQDVHIYLPKFKLETSYDLKPLMKTLGVNEIFDPKHANFGRISDNRDLYVSDALHKALVEVDEEGTVAAAVTVIGMRTMAVLRPQPVIFKVEHPFAFFIRDKQTGINLFSGVINEL